jgi:uncharacterized membrane protein YccF (DUF307 family)
MSEMIPPPPQSEYTIRRDGNPGCLIQALWFIFIGWWLGLFSLGLAWFFNITIIGLPVGLWILNGLPMVIALQSPEHLVVTSSVNGKPVTREQGLPQHNFFLRALFFIFIGWWWSLVWLLIAYLLCATILLLPLGLWMFRLTPFMTTLKRY